MPDTREETRKKANRAAGAGAGAAIIAAAAILSTFTPKWEGTKLKPYRDLGGVWTVCTGETRVEMKTYTPQQCKVMLTTAIQQHYGPPVLRCAPWLAGQPFALAATIDLAYNAGPNRACTGPMQPHFKAGRWAQGCNAFRGYIVRVRGNPNPIRGLVNRRNAEADLCLGKA